MLATLSPTVLCPTLQMSFRHRSNPVFDEMLELVLDGSLTRQPDLAIEVEVRCRSGRWMPLPLPLLPLDVAPAAATATAAAAAAAAAAMLC